MIGRCWLNPDFDWEKEKRNIKRLAEAEADVNRLKAELARQEAELQDAFKKDVEKRLTYLEDMVKAMDKAIKSQFNLWRTLIESQK